MALNPAFESQTSRPLPLAYGYVYGSGDKVVSIEAGDGFTVELYILGEGEWESVLYLSVSPGDTLATQNGGQPLSVGFDDPLLHLYNSGTEGWAQYFHFHGGGYGTKGLPINMASSGPEQASDIFYQELPSVCPALNLSGLAYYMVRRAIYPAGTAITGDVAVATTTGIQPVGIFRSTKCRIFDANGNVTGYGFTTNPTWQMLDTILRKHIKPQQPPLAGLTSAERACFDWPAMVAHAARNAYILPNGAQRFAGNWLFAADASVQSIMEQQLRNCRSFKRERGGIISFVGDDERASVFIASQKCLVPGSLKIQKKDLSTAPNVFVPVYRELGIPAVAEVASVSSTGTGQCTFKTKSQQPFGSFQPFVYAGGTDDAVFAGNYEVAGYTEEISSVAVTIPPTIPNQFNTIGGPATAATATGGYLGTQASRFSLFAPAVVQHRSHQRSIGAIAPGISPLPRPVPVRYDLGNNTFDQTNRLMKFERDRNLGTDGPGWIAPFEGTVSLLLESVDVNGVAALQIEDHDVITLDGTAAPDFAGVFEVLKHSVKPPMWPDRGSQLDLTLQTYNPNAATDVSDDPGSSFLTLPYSSTSLPMGDFLVPVPLPGHELSLAGAPATPYYVTQATLTGGLDGSGNLKVSLPDLAVWWSGEPLPTLYQGVLTTTVPLNTVGTLYLVFTSKLTLPTLLWIASTSSTVTESGTSFTVWTGPDVPVPNGYSVVAFGQFATSSSVSSGAVSVPATLLATVATLPLGTLATPVDFIPTLNLATYEETL